MSGAFEEDSSTGAGIHIQDLADSLHRGMSQERFAQIKGVMIRDSSLTVGDYVDRQIGSKMVVRDDDGNYSFSHMVRSQGLVVSEGVPPYFSDASAHSKFADDLFGIVKRFR